MSPKLSHNPDLSPDVIGPVTIIPSEAVDTLDQLSNLERMISTYGLGTCSWDDVIYYLHILSRHLHQLLRPAAAALAPPLPVGGDSVDSSPVETSLADPDLVEATEEVTDAG